MIIKRLLLLQALLLVGLGSVFLIPQKTTLGPAGIGMTLPDRVGRWTGEKAPVSQEELKGLAPDTQFAREWYTNPAGDRIFVSIVLSGADMGNSIHRPERCLVAQGWTVEASRSAFIPMPDGKPPLEVTALTDVRQWHASEKAPPVAVKNLNYYWFIGSHDITASHLVRTIIDIRDRLLHGDNQRWAYVTVAAYVTDNMQVAGRTQEETTRIVEDFIAEIVPKFQPGGSDVDDGAGNNNTPSAKVGATPVPTPQRSLTAAGTPPACPPVFDHLIVGAGFAGAVLAERLASQLNRRCLVVDRRDHIGGNAYDFHDKAGVLLHQYGPHYFRTNSERGPRLPRAVHGMDAGGLQGVELDGRPLLAVPDQPEHLRTTPRPAVGQRGDGRHAGEMARAHRAPAKFGEVIVSQVGRALYEKFFQNYTRKQWQREPSELDAAVCGRIPIRTNRDDRYVSDRFQEMPRDGYTAMFERMLAHPNIEVRLRTGYREARAQVPHRHLVYTGPVDEYFDHCHGPLPYRSLRFEPETIETEFYQPAVQVNYPNDFEYTRVLEIKHITGQKLPATTVVREYPQDYGPGREPYYPLPAPDARALYKKYEAMADAEKNVSFVGRMATYRYYNMDQVVGMSLAEFERLKEAVA